jgi:hypothetical protein
MLRECHVHDGLCVARALGVSGVVGRGSMVPDSPSSSVSVWCRPLLVLLVLVLVLGLVLVPSTCSLVSSVLLCIRRPLEFGRRL